MLDDEKTMIDYAFRHPTYPCLPIMGTSRLFPVRRIFCVGRNYAEHALEMGHKPDVEPPFFFCKAADTIAQAGADIPYPPQTQDLHYEAELVIAIGKRGQNINPDHAHEHIYGYAIGNDLTRRDLQRHAKRNGLPWDWAKAFDNSAVVGPVHQVSATGYIERGYIYSTVNGALRQQGDISQMIWPPRDIIAFISQSMAIAPGDLVFTGTPSGVGQLLPGDLITIEIERLGRIHSTIVASKNRG